MPDFGPASLVINIVNSACIFKSSDGSNALQLGQSRPQTQNNYMEGPGCAIIKLRNPNGKTKITNRLYTMRTYGQPSGQPSFPKGCLLAPRPNSKNLCIPMVKLRRKNTPKQAIENHNNNTALERSGAHIDFTSTSSSIMVINI